MAGKPDQKILDNFGLKGDPESLAGVPGLERSAFRVGNFVLRKVNRHDSIDRLNWLARLSESITANGFRVSRPLKTKDGKFIDEDGWTAWTFLEGKHDLHGNIKETMAAIIAFHEAIKNVVEPDYFKNENHPYGRADKSAWGNPPESIMPEYKEGANLLYGLRKPISELREQVIHGDLNPYNILIAPGQPPAILDIAPCWRPPEFALAVYAYWIGPWENQPEVLQNFSHIKEFRQLLVRAGIRMLITMSEFNLAKDVERYSNATRIIAEYLKKNT